jgi:hypothetical protein
VRHAPLALVLVLAAAALAVGCSSPEARRAAGGGPGADIGNRRQVVRMHEGSRPYAGTPTRIGRFGETDLAGAQQAQRLTLRTTRQ